MRRDCSSPHVLHLGHGRLALRIEAHSPIEHRSTSSLSVSLEPSALQYDPKDFAKRSDFNHNDMVRETDNELSAERILHLAPLSG